MPDSALILFAQPTTAAKARRFGGATKIHYPTYDRQMARIAPQFNTLQLFVVSAGNHTDNLDALFATFEMAPEHDIDVYQKISSKVRLAATIANTTE